MSPMTGGVTGKVANKFLILRILQRLQVVTPSCHP